MAVQFQQLVFGDVAENRRTDVIDRLDIARAAAVVVRYDLQAIGDLRQRGIILLGAEEGRGTRANSGPASSDDR